ncbi:helix-turn-helix domain-containing protein [Dyadobacter sp. CY312]|uniref:AraC family transcriptional regulator n=1 Tax=Dyadobacter sp. CY312 TaxID=2907303 RepID=UPI001F3B27A6|nr:helix-turn-helix domain-containing protein [Dyadobacter sp. CY312]MCE7040856.1 helix-turn-helix domain-containing protein [Dyadobacter sp. CY312]
MESIGKHFEVSAPLDEIIRHFYCIRTSPDFEKIDKHLLPNLEMMLVFNFGKSLRLSFADQPYDGFYVNNVAVIGPLRKMLNYEVLPDADLIIAEFNVDGFYRLFQLPMSERAGEEIWNPDEILKAGFHELWDTLKDIPLQTERLELLKDFMLAIIQDSDDCLKPLFNGISYLNNPLIQPVRAMALDSEFSERTIQNRFKKYLGYSPKELLRFLRFKQVIAAIQQQERLEVDWYRLIEEFGYHDQSHLIKDFHHYLGITPKKFVKEIIGKKFCVSKPGKFY